MHIIVFLIWDYDVPLCLLILQLFYFTSSLYRVRLYTVFDRIFDIDWRVTEWSGVGVGGPPKSALAQGPSKA